MSKKVPLSCFCGQVKGQLQVEHRSSFHVHCYCVDCQEFAKFLENKEKILDKNGASEIFQTFPQYLQIDSGADHIKSMRLTPKGLLRWYTDCCGTPLANTANSSKIPFMGVSVKLFHFSSEEEKIETLGPVVEKAFAKYAIGETPSDANLTFSKLYVLKVALTLAKGLLLRKAAPSPFFKNGELVAKPKILRD